MKKCKAVLRRATILLLAGMMVLASLGKFDAYEPLELLDKLTLNDIQAYLRENFDTERCSLSVVRS